MKTKALLCVVEYHHSIRKSLDRLFELKKYPVNYFSSAESFLNQEAHEGPCCLLLDIQTPGLGVPKLQQVLMKDRRTEQIILVSANCDASICARAFKAGVFDFLVKPLKEPELLQAVETGLARSEQLFRLRNERETAHALLEKLTPREREVLGFVIAGKLNKLIAAELHTTEKTIKKHRGHVMNKLNVSSLAELVHFSLQAGLKPACAYGTKVPYTEIM